MIEPKFVINEPSHEMETELQKRAEALSSGTVYHVKRSPDDSEGIKPGIFVENGNLILDFGQPIQHFGLTLGETEGFIMGLMAAWKLAKDKSETEPVTVN